MLERVQKLLSVKSIVTIVSTAVFCYLSVTGAIGPDLFMSVFSTIIAFYFGTQATKGGGANGN